MRLIEKKDLQPMALGCALLGSGGGGNPAYDLLIAEHAIEQHGAVQLISIDELDDDALVVPLAFVGAPLIAMERLPSGQEIPNLIKQLQKLGKSIVLMPAEIGGANGLSAFAAASRLGLPVLDGDTLGRAFPELQMSSCNLYGVSPSPSYFADCLGNFVQIEATDPKALERIGRHVSMSMGSSCAVAVYLMQGRTAKKAILPNTVSQALDLGEAILDARKKGMSPANHLLEKTEGRLLASGIITEVKQEIKEGFLQGSVILTDSDRRIEIIYQNEYLLAKEEDEVMAATPDILAIIETTSGMPITSDQLKYGLKVDLLMIPSPAIWKTEEGFKLVGPEYFGYKTPKKEAL